MILLKGVLIYSFITWILSNLRKARILTINTVFKTYRNFFSNKIRVGKVKSSYYHIKNGGL
jgi:hypothetical protein